MPRRQSADLTALGPQRVFTGPNLNQIVFPLGGIGTGSVGLTGRGSLKDWEVFNRPNFGSVLPYTFPMIYAREKGKDPVCRVLEGPVPPPYVGGGGGDPHANGEGFPHMDAAAFRGEYPFAWIDFSCGRLPVSVSLEAYNPFIPSAADDSGYPAAILRYTLVNTSPNDVTATVAWSLFNAVGSVGEAEKDKTLFGQVEYGLGGNINEYVERDGLRGLYMYSAKWAQDHPRFGSLALTTPEKTVTVMKYWAREGWFTPRHELWDAFSATGNLPDHDYAPSEEGRSDAGMLGVKVRLKPGQTKTVTFYLTWYFPNFEMYWHPGCSSSCKCEDAKPPKRPAWKNYYAGQFADAFDVACRLYPVEKELRDRSRKFHDALFASTLPPYVLDAVSSQMAILKTATCLRLEDGTFYGFEGCAPVGGCCEGSCTHVWNYQQTLPFLFPSLERGMRTADYQYNLRKDGGMCFRLQLPLGADPNDFHACADGQMGGIIKTYRDWKISGDDAWLRSVWPHVRTALEYAWVQWDTDQDGVMDGIQHNTYDIEFLGPNPLMACFYLGALEAGAEMADFMGEPNRAAQYRTVAESGRRWVEANLFNGEYYVQKYDPAKAPEYQFGEGCLSDAMLGQWIASLSGLGYLLDPTRVSGSLKSIHRHNWRKDLSDHANAQRVYALGNEAGLILCTWPRGGRPAVPFPYSDEVWTGIEYQVASHLIMEGMLKEGLGIVKGARDRHDGYRRNPWDEFECGHHYARAMSAYGLLLALSGFTYDKGVGTIGFAPCLHEEDFRVFWALDGVWGMYRQTADTAVLEVLEGEMQLTRLDLPWFGGMALSAVAAAKGKTDAVVDDYGSVLFPKGMLLKAGQNIALTFTLT